MCRGSPVCQQMWETIIELSEDNVLQIKIKRDLHISPLTVQNIGQLFKQSEGIPDWEQAQAGHL